MLGRLWIRPHQAEHLVRAVPAGSPDLLAVDDEVVAIARRASLQARQVRTGARFAVALAPDVFAARDLREVPRLLLFAAVDDQRRPDHADAETARTGIGRAPVPELLVKDHLLVD